MTIRNYIKIYTYYQNARSLRRKYHEFIENTDILAEDYDVLVITETWLNKDILRSEFVIFNYNLYRTDRKKDIAEEEVC